jgi:hypothetical protein
MPNRQLEQRNRRMLWMISDTVRSCSIAQHVVVARLEDVEELTELAVASTRARGAL